MTNDNNHSGAAVLITADARTGAVRRRTALPMKVVSIPIVRGAQVLVEGNDGCVTRGPGPATLVAVGAADGELTWRQPLPGAPCAEAFAPIVAGDVVLGAEASTGCGEHHSGVGHCPLVTAFDVTTGRPLWRIHASVLFANEDGFVAETPHGLADLDPATGTARWTVRLSYGRLAGADATPHLLEGRGSRSLGFIETNVIRGPSLKPGHVPQTRPTILETAVDLDTADVRWQLALPNDVHLFTGKNVFGFNNGHRLVALDASTGSELWQRSYAAGSNHSAILAANATIYINAILGARSKITALDARTGAVRWEATGKGNVALAAPHDGMLYTAGGPEHFALDPNNGHALWTYSRRIIPQAIQRDRLFATRNAHRYDVGD